VALWRGLKHLSAICVCIEVETRRGVERSLLVTETQVAILSARAIFGLTEELACEPNPCPAAPVICNHIIIFFKDFNKFFLLVTTLVT
jgi:hypothetical protein